jgi:hypothetical protein
LGLPTAHTKGAHLLPDDVTGPLAATLVRSLTTPELHRALRASVTAATTELARTAPATAARLGPLLDELVNAEGEQGSRGVGE